MQERLDQIDEARKRLQSVFRFVQALNNRRNPPQRLIDSQPWRYWLRELPDHSCIDLATVLESESRGAQEDDEVESTSDPALLVRVRRPELTPPPTPPEEIRPWLIRGWDDPSYTIEVRASLNEQTRDGTAVVRFGDDQGRVSKFEEWRDERSAWAAAEKPARDALRCFEVFYELHARIERDAESLELLLGDGLLNWNVPDGRIRHPLLLQRVDLRFDPKLAEFSVTDTDTAPELYSAVLQSISEVDGGSLRIIREELSAGGFHPLGGASTGGFLRALITRLAARGRFLEDGDEDVDHAAVPALRRAPVLFLRSRSLGFATSIQDVIDDLGSGKPIPASLVRVVGIETEPAAAPGSGAESEQVPARPTVPCEDEILFSLPANPEQLRIAQRLESDGGVLVQGPPGTGKTHTIANLLGHLLAKGKSVLVTSHTTKALKVLRDKVAPELRPLCISVLESDAEGRRMLESSVSEIAERLSRTDVAQSERRASSLKEERDHLLARIGEKTLRLKNARADEYRPIVVGGRSWAPSEAARWAAEKRGSHSWIPTPILGGAPLPLSRADLERLYATNRELSADTEAEIDKTLPDPSLLPTAVEFEQFVAVRKALLEQDKEPSAAYWPQHPIGTDPDQIDDALGCLADAVGLLPQGKPWKLAVALAGLRGGGFREPWEQLMKVVASAREESARAQAALVEHTPQLSSLMPLEEQLVVAREILEVTRGGKKLSAIRLTFRSSWKRFVGSVSVGGGSPTTVEHFEALETAIHLELTRRSLRSRWDAQVSSRHGPTANSQGVEVEQSLGMLMPTVQGLLDWAQQRWAPARKKVSDLGFSWDGFERDQPVPGGDAPELTQLLQYSQQPLADALKPMIALLRWEQVEARHEAWLEHLEEHRRRHGDMSSTGFAVYQALRAVSPGTYAAAMDRLSELWASSSVRSQRRALLERLSPAAPGWAAAISQRTAPHDQLHPPGDPEEAWHWRQIEEELQARARTSISDLQAEIDSAKDQMRSVTTDLISCRAWAQQAKRTSLAQKQALLGWLGAIKKLGKYGTVKRAAQLKHQAQENLAKARSAVPVWIMPTSRVVESFRPSSTTFDVAIIDEASQCDLVALVVLYLAKTVIVVGDHEQVSPSAVGEDQRFVGGLVHEYLTDVPNRALFDGRRSVYDLARESFGETICLVEHFRSVPEIIEFSNQLSYEGRVKPLRESGSSSIRPFTVPYRVQSSGVVGKMNRDEACAVASLIISACELPEYRGATFGAISMVGEETAFEIDRLIRLRVDPVEYQTRRIRCGNPAQFQGDERDVMMIALVDVPEEGPLSLRAHDEWKKRFNVAASRPRNQLWVVHSLDPSTDLKPGDLRRRLIEHVRDPKALEGAVATATARAESPFETAVIRRLVESGYRVRPQFSVGHYRIDIVVEGATKRLAIECDGDRYHPLEKLDEDLARQGILERLGWRFARIRGTAFFSDPAEAMKPVFEKLENLGVERLGPAGEREAFPSTDLSDRVILRAAELRREWDEQEKAGVTLAAPRGSTRPGYWRSAAQAVPDNESDEASEAILRTLAKEARPLSRSEVLTLTRVPEIVWHAAIRKLRDVGKVVSVGEKRGTKWEVVRGGAAGSEPVLPRQPTLPTLESPQPGPQKLASANSTDHQPGLSNGDVDASLATFLARHQLKASDGRGRGDPLYVYVDDSQPDVVRQLRAWGFSYNRYDRRWWTRDPREL